MGLEIGWFAGRCCASVGLEGALIRDGAAAVEVAAARAVSWGSGRHGAVAESASGTGRSLPFIAAAAAVAASVLGGRRCWRSLLASAAR